MRRAALTAICLAAVAAWVAPSAIAAPGTLSDQEFGAGLPEGTWVTVANTVRLDPEGPLHEFSALPPGWIVDDWADGGGATFSGSRMTVDGALVYEDALGSAGQVLEMSGLFGGAAFQNLGYSTRFESPGPWAAFSTSAGSGLYARTAPGTGTGSDTLLAGIDRTVRHDYRIEWGPSQVRYFVDEQQVATHDVAIPGQMRTAISDFDVGGNGVGVYWSQSGVYTSGTFTSRVLGGMDARTVWQRLTAAPGDPGVTFETRSGNTATPGPSWSGWQPVGAGGAIQSPFGQYIQYRATFTATDPTISPTLSGVTIAYDIDDTKPGAVINGIDVALNQATVRFSSPDPDVARFECSRDGAPAAACTSPTVFGGLTPGAHSVSVRAVDRVGNVGDAAIRTFVVPTPAVRKTNVSVSLLARSLRATRRGAVNVRVRCVRAQVRCRVTVRLRRGGNTVARKTVTIAAGKARAIRLRLTRRGRRALAGCRRVSMTASVVARDTAGNRRTIRRKVTVRQAGCRGAASVRR